MPTIDRTTVPETMGIRELKANLSQVLKRVQAGERVTITHHGARIVDLVPATEIPAEDLTLAEAMAKLDRKYGPAKNFDVMQLKPVTLACGKSLSEQLLEDRGERF